MVEEDEEEDGQEEEIRSLSESEASWSEENPQEQDLSPAAAVRPPGHWGQQLLVALGLDDMSQF